MRWRFRGSIVLSVAWVVACSPVASPEHPQAAKAKAGVGWGALVEEYVEAYFVANPDFAVAQGRHEFDGKMPDWSPAGLKKEQTWLEDVRRRVLAFREQDLSQTERFQRDYVLSQIEGELFWLRDLRAPYTNPIYYFGAGLDPSTYVNRPYAPAEQRARAFIHYVRQVPAALQQLRANLELPLPKTFVDFSVIGFKGFAEFYRKDVLLAFEGAGDAHLQAELRQAIEPAANAMLESSDWFAAQTAFAEHGYKLGPERFAAMLLNTERVSTSLETLEAIGRADLARNLDALAAACGRYAPGVSIEACIERSNANKPAGGAVEGARAQLAELRRFVVERDLVSIPGEEEATVAEAPAYKRQNFAYIEIPGPYERNLPSVYYIAPPDPSWSQAEQAAYIPAKADLLFTSVHEVWPGHFLQFLHSNRSTWRFGQLFMSYAFIEGWAHYAEELVVEEGLAKNDPELAIGQLQNALLRNVRYLCAIGLHARDMTVGQCEQMFKEVAYQDPGNARQQAARGTYDPGYSAYTMGKLMLRKLRSDWRLENPGRSLREFHDALLSHGSPPIPLLRARLLRDPGGEPL